MAYYCQYRFSITSVILCILGGEIFAPPVLGAEAGQRKNDEYRLVLRAKEHVVDWNENITLDATLSTTAEGAKRFRAVGASVAIQRMSFFHRDEKRIVHLDNEPVDRMATALFPNFGVAMGGLLLTAVNETTFRDTRVSHAKGPGSFIMRVEWDIREREEDGSFGKPTQIISNWVLVTVNPSPQWILDAGPTKPADFDGPLNEQEVLERLYRGRK